MRALAHFALHWHLWLLPLVGQFGDNPFDGSGSFFGGLFSDINSALAAIAAWLWAALTALWAYIWALLTFLWNFLKRIVGDIGSLLNTLWNKVIKGVLVKIIGTFLKVRQWLSNLLAPVLKIIKQIRAWYDQYFNQFVRPVLRVIRQLRQVLQIFRLLGFKWAARLDADLARIENKIVSAYVTLRGYLNVATSWIQLVVDPLGILRRNPLFAALVRSAPELRNLMDVATIHTQTQTEVDTSNQHNGWGLGPTTDEEKAALQKYQLTPYLQAQQDSVVASFNALPGLANQQLG